MNLGATNVIDRNADVAKEVKKLLGDTPVPVVYDAVSLKDTQVVAWDVLAPGGQLLLVLAPEVDKDKYKDKHVVHVFGSVHAPASRAFGKVMYSNLTQLLEKGDIKVTPAFFEFQFAVRLKHLLHQPNKIELIPNGLAGIADGLKRLENNQVSGVKLIARPFETA